MRFSRGCYYGSRRDFSVLETLFIQGAGAQLGNNSVTRTSQDTRPCHEAVNQANLLCLAKAPLPEETKRETTQLTTRNSRLSRPTNQHKHVRESPDLYAQ